MKRRFEIVVLAAFLLCGCSTNRVNNAGGGDAGVAGSPGGGTSGPLDGGGQGGGDLSFTDGGVVAGHNYGSDGPFGVTSVSFTVASPAGGSFTVVGDLPSGMASCPVVMLSSGLQQPAAAYAPYGHRLATWGVIALTRDDPGVLSQTSTIVGDVEYVVGTWLAAQNADSTSMLYHRVDLSHVGLAGHSRGGQVSLLAAEGTLAGKLRGVFGLDPVDSSMSGMEARTALGSIGIPTAFVGETTDGSGSSACAPAADNYAVLYAAAPTPSVAITAIGADHTQFEDPASCAFCTLCTAGSANAAEVLAYSVRYLTTFFARELLGDTSVDAALGSAQDVAAGLVSVQTK